MNPTLLIDAIVKQTTVLIAQLATSAGVRAPLAHVANQVFLDLVTELERQGVGRKVVADMFGLALRSYQRKVQRLTESATVRGRSLWEAVLVHVQDRRVVGRAELLQRFHRDDEGTLRGILRDMVAAGLLFESGAGQGVRYRAATDEDLGFAALGADADADLGPLVWVTIYRLGPLDADALRRQLCVDDDRLERVVAQLVHEGHVSVESREDGVEVYGSDHFLVPLDAHAGWAAAVFDHYQAVVRTVISRLRDGVDGDEVGGSTWSYDGWPGHPLEERVRGQLARTRAEASALRAEVDAYNDAHGVPDAVTRVTYYLGQTLADAAEAAEGDEP